jgi:hypothetical protein
MTNEAYTTQPEIATGRLGDEASMIAHVAMFGVTWVPEPAFPEPDPSTTIWTERVWSQWTMVDGSRPHR